MFLTARSSVRFESPACFPCECRAPAAFAPRGSLLAVLLAAAAAGQEPLGPPGPAPQATVYRDVQGMPHIVADNEPTAWYALGYEQARDALLWIQFACKSAKGELTWARGVDGFHADFIVKLFNTHGRLLAMSDAQRRDKLAPTNPNIQANFYDNCVAFAAGADAYRQAVQNAPPTPLTPERQLRNWLSQNRLLNQSGQTQGQPNLAWVYQDPIDPVDIAAMGGSGAAVHSFFWPGSLVNSAGASYGNLPSGGDPAEVDPDPPTDPLAPGYVPAWLEQIRQRVSSLPGVPSAFSGSNTFAWSRLHCQDASPGTTTYAGLLGDPHQPIPSWAPDFRQGFYSSGNHQWFAHVKVTPTGASQPSLDVIGHCAGAAFFTGHNRNVAWGGTLGAPNHVDTFLLRLRETASGDPAVPEEFYSYYHDPTGSNATWRPITTHTITLKRWDNTLVPVNYWRADSFGVILPRPGDVLARLLGVPQPTMPIVYGERIDPTLPGPQWRVAVPPPSERMRFWTAKELDPLTQLPVTSPMVVALRSPIDPKVAGEDMHLQLLRDIWEINHATTVFDVIDKTNGAAVIFNVCFVDRDGRTLSTQMSAIPQRGDDTQMFAAGYHTLDKWAIYCKGFGPVPARYKVDQMFDWRFGGYTPPEKPTPLIYLPYPNPTANPPTIPFKAMTLQDQGANTAFPPTSYPATGPFRIESGFFASACNDLTWGFSRKRDTLLQWVTPGPFNNVSYDNTLLNWVLDCGVAYQTPVLGLEAPPNQTIVVSRFTQQAERIVRGAPAGLAPLTPAQMRDFVVTPELYHEDSYGPPAPLTWTSNPALPTPIRQLKEVVDNPSYSAVHPVTNELFESPLVAAQKELAFFTDLWTTLFSPPVPPHPWNNHAVVGASPSVTLSLRDLWVNGSVPGFQDKIFWYDDPTHPTNPGLRWIDLPPEFPLIDFFWPESEVSRGVTAGTVDPNGLSSAELGTLGTLVSELVIWDPAGAHYRNVPTSRGACLLEMMRMGYNALTDPNLGDFGRHWVRLKRGQVEYSGSGWSSLTGTGQLPGGGSLVKQNRPWSALSGLAFPGSHLATLFRGTGSPPYDALYVNPVTRQVRTTLGPTHTNALVAFFLQLGNHYIEPQANNGNPSRKLARFQLLGSTETAFLGAGFHATYPLTDGLLRLTAVRALLDTGTYLQSISPGIPRYDQCFRTRAYDHTGQIWPALPTVDTDCVGASLRSVAWHEAPDTGHVACRGFQPKFLGIGGSIATMLALFPSVGQGVDSYYWCTPGVEVMSTLNPARFDAHMNAFRTNTLLPTHYDDFLNPIHVAWSFVHTY